MRSTAIHEAGHVVASLTQGGRAFEANIRRRGDYVGHAVTKRLDHRRDILTYLAGGVAEQLAGIDVASIANWPISDVDARGVRDDLFSELLFQDDPETEDAVEVIAKFDAARGKLRRAGHGEEELAQVDQAEDEFWMILTNTLLSHPNFAHEKPQLKSLAAEVTRYMQETRELLKANWTKVERVADALLEKKTISGPELEKMFEEESNTTLTV